MNKSRTRQQAGNQTGKIRNVLQHRVVRGVAAAALAATLATQLSACFPVAAGGVTAGVLMATDRRSSGTYVEDEGIEVKAASRLSDQLKDKLHVNVTSYNRKVLITGEVPDAATRTAIQNIVAGVENVTATVNELEIMAPSSLTARANDSLITGQVKAAFIDAKDIYASSFKVLTERGTVYLMGRVTQAEGNRAADVARTQRGVQRVVKVLEYITEDELKRLMAQRAPAENNAATGSGDRTKP